MVQWIGGGWRESEGKYGFIVVTRNHWGHCIFISIPLEPTSQQGTMNDQATLAVPALNGSPWSTTTTDAEQQAGSLCDTQDTRSLRSRKSKLSLADESSEQDKKHHHG